MNCPKCKESFVDGSRRFCPTDGARLISESDAEKSRQGSGIFANLLAKIDSKSGFAEKLSDIPGFVNSDPPVKATNSNANSRIESESDIKHNSAPAAPEIQIIPEKLPRIKLSFDRSKTSVKESKSPAENRVQGESFSKSHVGPDFDPNKPNQFVGRLINGRYLITDFIGNFESRLEYLAFDKLVENKKVFFQILFDDDYDEIMGSILAEERISFLQLNHPNIARLIYSGEFSNGTNYLISEYFDSLSVKEILTIHGQFDRTRTALVIKQTANALNAAHQEGILHRDLRPENMIIETGREKERVKLINFGSSRGGFTAENIIYKAPEVLDGRIATVASDIFSLSVSAYQMLTGHTPFTGVSKSDLLKAHNDGLAMLPSDVRPELSSLVDEVLLKALALNASDRYSNAREFGEALYRALTEPQNPDVPLLEIDNDLNASKKPVDKPFFQREIAKSHFVDLPPAVSSVSRTPLADEPAWKSRSPELPATGSAKAKLFGVFGILTLATLLVFGWYYLEIYRSNTNNLAVSDINSQAGISDGSNTQISNTDMPPQPRDIPQPPDTSFYQNNKQNLTGDLVRNFVGFTLYYPKDWKINGPQSGKTNDARGKFLDISRLTADGRMKEQMLVSYYPSKGTFTDDADKFPQMIKETNDVLKTILPGYEMVSEGEIKINGEWRAYEIKFQGTGTSETGEKLMVWGRRLFIPAARHGVRNGFEITMLATPLANDVRSADDIGVRGELAAILYSFEPSQNF